MTARIDEASDDAPDNTAYIAPPPPDAATKARDADEEWGRAVVILAGCATRNEAHQRSADVGLSGRTLLRWFREQGL